MVHNRKKEKKKEKKKKKNPCFKEFKSGMKPKSYPILFLSCTI